MKLYGYSAAAVLGVSEDVLPLGVGRFTIQEAQNESYQEANRREKRTLGVD